MWNRLKARWNIKSNFQAIVIIVVFSLTGSASLIVKKIIFDVIGINSETSLWLKIPMYVLIIIPVYQILLLIIGTIFGQFRFFLNFEKKMIMRFQKK